MRPFSLRRLFLSAVTLLAVWCTAAPVEFSFRLQETKGNPYARVVSADVTTPDGQVLHLPAFLSGKNTWSVRTRAAAVGEYRLGRIEETTDEGTVGRDAKRVGPGRVAVTAIADPHGNVVIDPTNPRRFALADGTPFLPLGANLAWPEGPRAEFYAKAFADFRQAGLNWSRIWMSHWGGTNLDWTQDDLAPSPPIGSLSPKVAELWDHIVAEAEANGIRFQMVFQHHGQYSTGANANWQFNPWNKANGGFLDSPVAFFSDPQARALTKLKYRYIVARWGYSSAIMAWELFNEAMWTDARNGTAADHAAIATWHAEMAAYVRSIDAHRHLVTTSDDYLDEPLYAPMDYYQPHLYACHLLPSARLFDPPAAALDRPVFYGEAGEDNDPRLADGPKFGGPLTLPILWSSLMGDAAAPAQYWYTTDAMRNGLLPQFAAFACFVRENRIDHRTDLVPFEALVASDAQIPLVIEPALNWRQGNGPTVAVPLDGRQPAALGTIPRHFVSGDPAAHQKFPSSVTLQLDYPEAATATVRIAKHGADGASLRISLDGRTVAEEVWPRTGQEEPLGAAYAIPVTRGLHTLVLENPHGRDWFELAGVDTGLTCSPLAAVGKRSADFVCLWIWHRQGVYSEKGAESVAGTVAIDDLPTGNWRITWWNVRTGTRATTKIVDHGGGTLAVPTPPVARHAALTLARVP